MSKAEDKIYLLLENFSNQSPVAVVGSLSLAVVNFVLSWNKTNHDLLIAWLFLVSVVVFYRLILKRSFLRDNKQRNPMYWVRMFTLNTFLHGLAWSFMILFCLSYLDYTDNIVLMISVAGLVAGAVTSSFISSYTFATFSGPVLIPAGLYLLTFDVIDAQVIGGMLIFYFFLTLRQSNHAYKMFQKNIDIQVELKFSSQEVTKLADDLYQQSNTDALTQIPNRRCFDDFLALEWQRSMRSGVDISMLLIDVDYFKKYNDTRGHQEGDECLIKIAAIIAGSLRRTDDFCARYGGEEFVVVLPHTTQEMALTVANNVCQAVESLGLPHGASTVSDFVTVSVGVHGCVPKLGDADIKEFIATADKALYSAKGAGRNRVSI